MNKTLLVAGVAAAQLALVGVAVAPQLSARAVGETYFVQVEPLDPVDPFRGTYVALDIPSLEDPDGGENERPAGDVYVSIAEEDGLWVGTDWSTERPAKGPYLACHRWGEWGSLDCGLDSFFVKADRARELEDAMNEVMEARWERQRWEEKVAELDSDADLPPEPPAATTRIVAEIKVDGRGHAAVVDVQER